MTKRTTSVPVILKFAGENGEKRQKVLIPEIIRFTVVNGILLVVSKNEVRADAVMDDLVMKKGDFNAVVIVSLETGQLTVALRGIEVDTSKEGKYVAWIQNVLKTVQVIVPEMNRRLDWDVFTWSLPSQKPVDDWTLTDEVDMALIDNGFQFNLVEISARVPPPNTWMGGFVFA